MEVLYLHNELSTSENPDNVLTALARANCLNLSNKVDFNKYGVKDNIGLTAVSDIFSDCFVVQLKYREEGIDYLSILRNLINSHGMAQASIMAIENDKFKIACPDYDISLVMNSIYLLKTSDFKLNCIDITQDYAGSFDKEELKHHLLTKCGFVEESFISKSHHTIMKSSKEPHTCLQYWNGKSQRCKVYLKMAEVLQSRSVRSTVGNRWLSWVVKNRRLAKSRDASLNRGLTRVEVTCYTDGNSCDNLSALLSTIPEVTQHLAPELIFSTPHKAMWHAYCDCFKHTLIVTNPQFGATPSLLQDKKAIPPGRALIVYSFNNLTKDISGRFIDKWNLLSNHAIDRHTISAKLPIDIMEVCSFRKGTSKELGNYVQVHVTRSKYFKSEDEPLHLTEDSTIFNCKHYTPHENEKYLTQAGMIEHPNCTISLPLRQHSIKTKTTTKLDLLCPKEDIQCNTISKKLLPANGNSRSLKLTDLPIGVYNIKEIAPRNSQYGRFLISIEYEGAIVIVTSNKILDVQIPTGGIKASNDSSTVASIHILQKKRDHNRNCIVNAELVIL